MLVVVVLFSLLSSLTSDLNMRMERPSERAARRVAWENYSMVEWGKGRPEVMAKLLETE